MERDERIKPDFSIAVSFNGEEMLINRIYDNVHIFEWLGHGILKIVGEEGFAQWHTSQQDALKVAGTAMITPVFREEITPHEYEQYLNMKSSTLTDDIFDNFNPDE